MLFAVALAVPIDTGSRAFSRGISRAFSRAVSCINIPTLPILCAADRFWFIALTLLSLLTRHVHQHVDQHVHDLIHDHGCSGAACTCGTSV